jgi:hypothetical protein
MRVEWIHVWTLFAVPYTYVPYPRILHGMYLKRPTLIQVTSYCLFVNLAIVLHLAQLPV